MSILLRKECQPALDEAGLEMLHVAIHDKQLALDGECGQTVVRISGIQFLSSTPKVAEVAYAVELFHKFLNKYNNELKTYIAAKIKFSELEAPTVPEGFKLSGINVTVDKLSFHPNGIIGLPYGYITFEEIENSYKKHIERVTEYFDAFESYKEANTELQKMRSDIAKCNI